MKKITILLLSLFLTICSFSQDVEKAMEYFKSEKYDSAAIAFEAALPLLELKYGATDTSYYSKQINYTAKAFSESQKYDKAEFYYLEVKSIYEHIIDTLCIEYVASLNDLAGIYYIKGNYNSALPLLQKASNIRRVVPGNGDPDYATTLNNLAMLNHTMGNYQTAIDFYHEAISIIKEKFGTKNSSYTSCLSNLAQLYSTLGKYENALPLMKEALTTDKEIIGKNDNIYAMDLDNLAKLYQNMGNYETAIPLMKEAIDIIKEIKGPKSLSYSRSLGNLATIYQDKGNYKVALQLYEENLKIKKEVLGVKHPNYAIALNNLATLYQDMGNNKTAISMMKEAISIDREALGIRHKSYVQCLFNLATFYTDINKFDSAVPLYLEVIKTDKEILGSKHPNYAASINGLAHLYCLMGDYDSALKLFEEAISIRKDILGTKHPDYAASINELARLYYSMGNYSAALPLFEETLNIRREVLGEDHPVYIKSLNDLASLYSAMGNYKAARPLFDKADTIIKQNIQQNFSFLSENEKENYLNMIEKNYEIYDSFLSKYYSLYPALAKNGFNNELFLKELILSSATKMQQTILESGDSSLTQGYEFLRVLKRQITTQQQKPISKRREDLAKLVLQANDLEREITSRSQTFSEMKTSFTIKWEDVQQKLREDEAAIEFISFHYYNKKYTDSTFYCAFILRKNDTLPRMAFLCGGKQLSEAIPSFRVAFKDINLSYHSQGLYNLIWHPIESLLGGTTTVYFAPSGLLNKVSLAAITCPDNKLLMDKYKLVQLSSTRTLAMHEEGAPIKNAVVYGGINYDTDTTALLTQARKYTKKEGPLLAYNRSATSDFRKGFMYLPGTKKEADLIATKLENKGISTSSYSGIDASEESFAALSGNNSPSVIHLSTHGFYYPDTISDENRKKMDLSGSGEVKFRYSDDPLLRSGLLLSGANLAWKGLPRPEGLEDGILTAKEVSNMNLMNTQLVVLSACQTGQGDVKGSEGVEGLQRGFKMAGVRYIIMSLWDVPDKETTEFMAGFYDNWLGGKDIHEAFRMTQNTMKNKYKNEPAKWAAFVLME
jgi:tetratricopeptide (TPR) repeat protein